MFSRAKNKAGKTKPKVDENVKKERQKHFLIDVPEMPNMSFLGEGDDNDEYDADLEAELLALTQDTPVPSSKEKRERNPNNLNKMVNECMRDDDICEESDEGDAEFLAELSALVAEESGEVQTTSHKSVLQPSLPEIQRPAPDIARPAPMSAGPSLIVFLKERKLMYEEAERNALETGEASRAKRFKRGLGTINQMLKTAEAGRAVKEEDIPPAVLISSSRSISNRDLSEADVKSVHSSVSSPDFLTADVNEMSVVQPNNQNYGTNGGSLRPDILPDTKHIAHQQIPSTSVDLPESANAESLGGHHEVEVIASSSSLAVVTQRQLDYKSLALDAKKKGDIETAMGLLKVAKQMQPLVDAARDGKEIDINSLPPQPSTAIKNQQPSITQSIEDSHQASTPALNKPVTIIEALQQRMTRYEQERDKAKAAGNDRKERMNHRIMKQFQEAITQVKTGRLIDFSELPTPPGFLPIPVPGVTPTSRTSVATPTAVSAAAQSTTTEGTTEVVQASPGPSEGPKPKLLKPNPVSAGSTSKVQVTPNVRNAPKSRVERQLSVLHKRQQLFREAALESKKKGEIEQAKEYLRNSKGFDQLILASEGGLPVDMNTAPIPPQEIIASFTPVTDFEIIRKEDCDILPPKTAGDMTVTYAKLEDDLISQIKMCATTREHFKAVGDVASANRFEQLILHSKKDLDSVRAAFKRGDSPPKFHYETRSFTMIQCNTELNDSDLEFVVVRGINYNVPNPKEVDTYVKVEFPYPVDSPPQDKTDVVKDSNCPEYNHKFLFSIDRKLRLTTRIFKRQSIKCQIINKGSWYHRDNVLGNVKIPLVYLENKCTLHESYDLLDDKKKMVGGKLEIKIRVRNPILSKQLEKLSEKWLVIDGF